MNRTALIAGATGLVGGHLLDILMDDPSYSMVKVLTRRSIGGDDGKLKEIIVEDFDQLESFVSELKSDDYFCCLGTTMKKAGSKEAFKKVDYEYPATLAAIARENGADSFSLVSAMGANSKSLIFYNRVKGEAEDAIKAMKLKKAFIFRPSFIEGERNEERTGEKVALWVADRLDFIFTGPLKKYGAIHAHEIAEAMVRTAKSEKESFKILESDQMKALV